MGKSTTSCFKFISCGCIKDSVAKDEINVPSENKGASKPEWSFPKESPTQRVQSNTVVTETIPSTENKQIPEPIAISSEPQVTSNISEKTSDDIWTEETPNSVTKNVTVSSTATKPACEEDDIIRELPRDESESAIVVIQAAVRRFLAERRLVEHKHAIKLQAAVRGHLVRNQAVGTLESHTPDPDQTEREVKTVILSNNVGLEEKDDLVNFEESSNVKTHEEESIVEPMVIPVSETKPEPIPENPVSETKRELTPKNPVSETKPEPTPENLVSETKPEPTPENPVSETKPEPTPENLVSETKPEPTPENPVSETKPEPTPENLVSETKSKSIPENLVSETEPSHTDQPDSAGRKYAVGSRKASNPAFVAAQSRFEELTSSKTNPLKSAHSFNQDEEAGSGSVSGSPADIDSSNPLKPDNEVVSRADIGSSAPGKATLVTDVEPYGSRVVQNGGSECGTELSITSTLDSPEHSETENKKFEEAEVVNEAAGDMNMNIDNNNNDNNNNTDDVMPVKQVDIEIEPESSHHVDVSNEPEPVIQHSESGSPRSHITTLESQGTPSSQVSTTTKKTKTDRKASGQKQKSWSTSTKSSPIRSSVTSGLRSSMEELPKDPKPAKRRISSGSPKPDHSDHEPSVPSYMQPTESARAKTVSSPRSSPDVNDKESYLKKRHSLSGAVNGRQGSPRVQRSMSQALQTKKGNNNQERKWQR